MPDAKNKSTNLIIGRGLIGAEVIRQELMAKLLRLPYRGYSHAEFLEAARQLLEKYEGPFAENLHGTDLAAWVTGYDDVFKKLPPQLVDAFGRSIGGPPRPPGGIILPGWFGDDDNEPIIKFPIIEKAAERLAQKNVLRRFDFDQASNQAKANAFTVAGDMTTDAIETIRDVLSETVEEGASLEGFRERLGERLEKSFLGPGHLEVVFRTQVQGAYHDGQDGLASHPIVAELFPYKTWDAIHDARVRSTHLALEKLGLSGTNVYRADDPFWRVWKQPAGFNCRCGSTYITIEDAARQGVQEANDWLRTGYKPPMISRLPYIPFKPDPRFASLSAA